MKNYKEYFKNKKVTVMGLGLLGKGLSDTKFLAECGADIIVTDLKTKEQLKSSVNALKGYKNITFSLGGHKLEDFENRDLILKGQGAIPLDSIYIKHARKNGIPVEMDEALFIKLVKDLNLNVNIIGVTGTRGKSTTTFLIYEMLKLNGNRVYKSGNVLGTTVLPLLKKVKNGDTVVFELSSWQLQGFGEDKISPHISVFTNFMPDHMNYYKNDMNAYFKDKSYIYKFQKENDYLVMGEKMKSLIKDTKAKKIIAKVSDMPKNWKAKLFGVHNKQNIMCAVEVARILKIKESIIKKAVELFTGAPGRLEFVKKVRGIKIYNDTNATTPEATIAALEALSGVIHPRRVSNTRQAIQNKVILIMGGMDKGIGIKSLNKILPLKTKKIYLTPGSGSDILSAGAKNVSFIKVKDLKEAVNEAWKEAKKGDIILFSPAFASFNMFKNEYDRGEQFMKMVKKLK